MNEVAMNTTAAPKLPRLQSLDALRGFDMFWIMSGEGLVHALAKASGWGPAVWMSNQLHHTDWNGITFYDMIFPLFLFIAGVSMPYSFGKQLAVHQVLEAWQLPGTVKWKVYRSIIRRTLILLLLGMVVNGLLRFEGWEQTRFASVLGRIGLAWCLAAFIYLNNGIKGQLLWFAGLLLGYWAVMMWVPVPGYGAGVLTMEGSLESYIDRLLLPGKLHDGVHDPEGILSTLPAVSSALLGVFAGQLLQWQNRYTPARKGVLLVAAGIVLILLGSWWNLAFPINKRLWTSSFVLYVGGFSLLFLAVFYLTIDVAGYRKWATPLVWIGTNSITIYMAAEGLINFGHTSRYLFGGVIQYAPANWQPVWYAAGIVVVQLAFLYFLYRNKWFLKI
ncbi:putative acyltransferase [Filimonas zeae]|uniref:DUF5009 domain-containing protein n=1 Tax=Filimonas zeae TaxID=1737353 RepID=A0A917J1D9_9BACT|nr:DUF5009 domain-containing protein [Filimonas zeae]MDR6341336.1 putative acyltransferase [Filimonas zeae]GGH76287.1 DUF5009 domain-containing protein [Filimonas zeae]